MTKNSTPAPVYLDPGMHPGLEIKGLKYVKIIYGFVTLEDKFYQNLLM